MKHLTIFIIAVMALNGFTVIGLSQTPYSEGWERVKALPTHSALIVERREAKRIFGLVISANDQALTIKTKDTNLIVDRSTVLRVYRAEFRDASKAKRRGALWGILAGVGLIALRESIAPSEAQDASNGILFVVGLGTGIGAAVKRAEKPKKGELLYDSKK